MVVRIPAWDDISYGKNEGGAEVGILSTLAIARVGKIYPAKVDEGAEVGILSTSAPKAAKLGKIYVAEAPENRYDYALPLFKLFLSLFNVMKQWYR